MNYIPLRCFTHGSILISQTKPKDIISRLNYLELDSCAITDISNMSMSVQFFQAMKKSGRKPILGMTLPIIYKEDQKENVVVLCKNKNGWKNLLQINIECNKNKDQSIELKKILEIGHDDLFFLTDLSVEIIPLKILKGYRNVPMPMPYYLEEKNWDDNKILACSLHKIHLSQIENCPIPQLHFNDFYLKSHQEMINQYSDKQLSLTNRIFDEIEEFNILNPPNLPKIANSFDILRDLCYNGAARLNKQSHEYIERLEKELAVVKEAGLSSYFLIVYDIVNFVKQSAIVGSGRGSVSGSIIPYFTGITEVDPIKYGLIFERFYNAGRNTKDKISLPDIDLDVPSYMKEKCNIYLKNKYGQEKVAQMLTFQTMKGSRSLTDVLRLTTDMKFNHIKAITKGMPLESKISSQLKEMGNRLGYESIIRWVLENEPKKFMDYCELNKDGNMYGDYAKQFEQAIRLEDTNCAASKHPAGVVISNDNLGDFIPMSLDKDNELVCGVPMKDVEALGGVKFDILGVKLLDVLLNVRDTVGSKI